MEEKYHVYLIPKEGRLAIEYRHRDGTKACDENGRPLVDTSRIKGPSQIEELVESLGLEPFLVIR